MTSTLQTAEAPPMAMVEFSALAQGSDHTLSSIPSPQISPLSESKKDLQKRPDFQSLVSFDDRTVSSVGTLRTAEETWFEDYCDANHPEKTSPSSSPKEGAEKINKKPSSSLTNSPSAAQLDTIAVPRPVRRHRRNHSAIPRMQTSSPGELPPLPPKRPSTPSGNDSVASSVASGGRDSPLIFDAKPFSPVAFASAATVAAAVITPKPRPAHRRTSSSPSMTLPTAASSPGDLLQAKLQSFQQQFGAQDSRVAAVWNMIGNSQFRNGQYESAIESYKEAIKCEPGAHLADSYGNMGTVLFAMNKLDEAVKFLTNALQVHEYNAVSSGKDPAKNIQIGSIQYQIGLAQTMRKHYDQAFLALKQSCKIRAAVFGDKHSDVAKTLDALGKVYLLRHNYKAALACHEEGLKIKRGLTKIDESAKSKAILLSLQNIAAVHKASNDVDAAIMAYGAVMGAQKKQMLEGVPSARAEAAETLVQLADLFQERGMLAKTKSCLQEADALLEEMGFSAGSPLRASVSQRLRA